MEDWLFLFGMNIMSSGLKKVAGEGVLKAIGLLSSYDTAGKEDVRKLEGEVDSMGEGVISFLYNYRLWNLLGKKA